LCPHGFSHDHSFDGNTHSSANGVALGCTNRVAVCHPYRKAHGVSLHAPHFAALEPAIETAVKPTIGPTNETSLVSSRKPSLESTLNPALRPAFGQALCPALFPAVFSAL